MHILLIYNFPGFSRKISSKTDFPRKRYHQTSIRIECIWIYLHIFPRVEKKISKSSVLSDLKKYRFVPSKSIIQLQREASPCPRSRLSKRTLQVHRGWGERRVMETVLLRERGGGARSSSIQEEHTFIPLSLAPKGISRHRDLRRSKSDEPERCGESEIR